MGDAETEIGKFLKKVDRSHSNYVLNVRKKVGLSQKEAAIIFGGGINAFSRYELGKATPQMSLIMLFQVTGQESRFAGRGKAWMNELLSETAGRITVPKDFFESSCIVEACSEYTHAFHFSFEVSKDEIVIVVRAFKGTLTEETLGKISNSLMDHQIWRELDKEFSHIRDMIVERAFAPLRQRGEP